MEFIFKKIQIGYTDLYIPEYLVTQGRELLHENTEMSIESLRWTGLKQRLSPT